MKEREGKVDTSLSKRVFFTSFVIQLFFPQSNYRYRSEHRPIYTKSHNRIKQINPQTKKKSQTPTASRKAEKN